jgi:hypothetical protein
VGGSDDEAVCTKRCWAGAPPTWRLGNLESQCQTTTPSLNGPVKHPRWQCPRCGTVIYFFGATSHMNRCWPGWERWREGLNRGAETDPDRTAETDSEIREDDQ